MTKKFEELMAKMSKTRMFPIDRQPISPAPPARGDLPRPLRGEAEVEKNDAKD